MTTSDGESSGDPLLSLLRDQIGAQHAIVAALTSNREEVAKGFSSVREELAKSLSAVREELATHSAKLDGMRHVAKESIAVTARATEVEAQRLAALEREEKLQGARYDVFGRVVQSPWAMALGGGLVAWALQRLGVAVDTAAIPTDVAP